MADEIKEAVQMQEPLPSDIVAFCALLARIMMRCLREKNPHAMGLLSLPSQTGQEETGGPHDAA